MQNMKKLDRFSSIGLGLILFLSFVGELHRFHGFLWLDFAVPLFVGLYGLRALLKKRPVAFPKTAYYALFFFLIGLASLLLHAENMSLGEVFGASVYGLRWISFYALSIIVFNQNSAGRTLSLWGLFALGTLLSIAGFIQLSIMPDFTSMEALGWDPHQGRLLSTWFDPNFVGGFLAFLLPIVLGTTWEHKKARGILFPLAALFAAALALTLSRSAYLALLAGLFVFGLLRSVKTILVMSTVFGLMILLVNPVQERFLSLAENAASIFTENYTLPDASARLRFASWKEGWLLFLEEPLLGHGYNRYKYAALELGSLKDLHIHSASGSDSSLLSVLATTGILGFLPFFGLYLILAYQGWQSRKTGYGAGFLAALCGLFIHCIFVNSLLFPLFMAPFWFAAGLLKPQSLALDQ